MIESGLVSNFWQQLRASHPEGFCGLSPMDGVTDLPMRLMTAKHGGPDVMFTEFTNVEGWQRGAAVLRKQLWVWPEQEGKVVAQLYGLKPENFRAVAAEIKTWGFAGIDLNMGCPAKNVALNGAGAGLIRNKALAQEIYLATKEGAGELPVSIKTRLGYDRPEILEWLGWVVEKLRPAALTVHGRTYRQGYDGQADWKAIGRAAQLTAQISPETVVIGNGDLQNRLDTQQRCQEFGIAGGLIGRASMGLPWVFQADGVVTATKRLQVAIEHAQLYEDLFKDSPKYSFLPLRKHLAWYSKGFPGASELRVVLTQTNSAAEVTQLLWELIEKLSKV